jgi:hypothetical protein
MLIRWMLVLIVLTLNLPTLPTLTRADEYDDQIRILDPELSMLYLRQQTIAAELSRERTFPDVQGSLMPRQRTRIEAPLEVAYLPLPAAPSPSMRPPWLPPVDPMTPCCSRIGQKIQVA